VAQVVGIGADTTPDQTIYDPTCGSGSLLLKAADEAPRSISIYGQEMDVATWALARMNMILHGHPTAEMWRGNTLAAPYFKNKDDRLKTFDFAVANPPFSAKAWASGLDPVNDEFGRFACGVPPAKNGDYAFLLHLIASLRAKGKGAIILPHGVLFRGHKEAVIRRNLIQRGLIKGIIGLPANLFYGTGIPACILVIDKEHAGSRKGIFMIDASKGFLKDGNKNRLRSQDIHKIVDVFNRQIELPRYSRMVPTDEIASPANDYNLNIPRYIDSSEPEDLHDLDAHLNGGIPNRDIDALGAYWEVFPTLRKALFRDNGREGYSEACVETQQVKATILNHAEFKTYAERVAAVFDTWRQAHRPRLQGIQINDLPKAVIHTLSEDLLARFADLPLLSRYDVYQRLMDYWAETMQDDVYLIAADCWVEAAKPRGIIEDKDKKIKETPELTIKRKKYKMDLVPPALIVARFFAREQAAIEALQAAQEAAARELEEFVEEHSGEEGLLEDATNDKVKVTKGAVKARLAEINAVNPAKAGSQDDQDELDALARCLDLIEADAEINKAVRNAEVALDEQVLARYAKLTEDEIRALVVADKWLASIEASVKSEVERLIQRLAGRVKDLEERYARPLPEVEREVDAFAARIEAHLKKMGLVCG
jgi:type I restriction enzyme M protein